MKNEYILIGDLMLKYKIKIIILFLIGLLTVNFVNAGNNPYPLLGRIIYLDPGHGGLDPGAIYKDIKESTINLEIANVLANTLEEMGAIVYITRYGDYDLSVKNAVNRKRSDLSRRGNLINKSGANLYLSLHLNSDPSPVWSGAQVFYDDVHPKNQKLAEIIQNELSKYLKTKRKVTKTDEMYLHKRIQVPGVLVELGFLSNPNDRYLLKQKTYQQKVSKVIANSLVKYFNKSLF